MTLVLITVPVLNPTYEDRLFKRELRPEAQKLSSMFLGSEGSDPPNF
jgi:hypothetical protein